MKISLVVPVFNEEDAIGFFYRQLRSFQPLEEHEVEVVFVDDGSTDFTSVLMKEMAQKDELIKNVFFTRNFGKEAALFAGLDKATGDVVIPIDVDLQDPLDVIPLMIDKWKDGADVVLAKRMDRSCDSHLKRKSAEWFYHLHNLISNPQIEENVGDFRLMSREVVEHIKLLPERNLFMKGILSWVGGKTDVVEYVRAERAAGKSKFNGWKLWNLALEGITSFSTFPLRMWTYIGLFVAGCSFFYGAYMLIDTLCFGNPVRGYTSIMVSMLFLGGVQLIGIGVLGEYIGRIYIETKNRPRYITKRDNVEHE